MKTTTESTTRNIARSLSMGVIISFIFLFFVHALGSWEVENYRPNNQTTFTLLLHNKCAVYHKEHVLRPNTPVPEMGAGLNGTKLSGSFMNFTDGHIVDMLIITLIMGVVIFIIRRRLNKKDKPA
jgi:hypothetical protein